MLIKPIRLSFRFFALFWMLGLVAVSCSNPQPAILPSALPPWTPSPSRVPSTASLPAFSPENRGMIAQSDYWPTKGWRMSTPEEQRMDSHKLALMLEAVKESKVNLHSLLVIRNGYIVSETYFQSFDESVKHVQYSCTKSFISTLVGIAIDKGYIEAVKRPVQDLIPGLSFEKPDARKQAMTLENLLTMTSGLDWSESDSDIWAMTRSSDWPRFMLNREMKDAPGSRFNYCSGCSHVLSAILQHKTNMNTRDFAQRELFEPLGISHFQWDTDPRGIPIGGWGLSITPRDMAKLGYLYLHNGTWDGKQVVSAEWIKTAIGNHIATNTAPPSYGYQWWIDPSSGAYMALGRGGQTIFVLPDLNLLVVTTADLPGHTEIMRLIEKYIVPAAQT